MQLDPEGPIVVFDGMCVLCTANARFILRHDHRGYFRLASMQSAVGAELFRRNGIDAEDPETIIVVDGERVLRNSDAVLSIYSNLGWPWRMMAVFKGLPRRLRDPVYLWLARNRYRIFGRRESCWLATAEQSKRVL